MTMTKIVFSVATLLACVAPQHYQVESFVVGISTHSTTTTTSDSHSSPPLFSSAPNSDDSTSGGNDNNEPPPKLILDVNQIQDRMAKLKSKYPTAEADYLAAARKRAELKLESKNNLSTDEDWKQAAEQQRQQFGGQAAATEDDWEASLKEAGNEDSQILIPLIVETGNDDEEPKLLL